jgi:hypothetical protein
MIKAKIRVAADNQEVSRSIIGSVDPDNTGLKGLKVTSKASSKNAYLTMSYDGSVETFISSLDDLLRCIQVARATLKTLSKEEN